MEVYNVSDGLAFYHNRSNGENCWGCPVEVVKHRQKLRTQDAMSTWDGEMLMQQLGALRQQHASEMDTLRSRVDAERVRQRQALREQLERRIVWFAA